MRVVMTSEYNHSAYSTCEPPRPLPKRDKLVHAEDAYKAALPPAQPPPCAHAEFGITLLR